MGALAQRHHVEQAEKQTQAGDPPKLQGRILCLSVLLPRIAWEHPNQDRAGGRIQSQACPVARLLWFLYPVLLKTVAGVDDPSGLAGFPLGHRLVSSYYALGTVPTFPY